MPTPAALAQNIVEEYRRQRLRPRPGAEIGVERAAPCLELDARRRPAKDPLESLQFAVGGGTIQQRHVGLTGVKARHARVASRHVQPEPLLGVTRAKALRPS